MDENREYAQVLEERDGEGNLLVRYVYGHDLISQIRDGITSFYHYDGLGSTRALTSSAGIVTDEYTYDAFGNLLDKSGVTENTHLYTGEFFDSHLGFYYLRARYMNPAIGRFVTMDSFAGIIRDPYSLHKYLYANANPVNMVDPSGMMSGYTQLTIATSVVGILSGMTIYHVTHAPEDRNPVGYFVWGVSGGALGYLLAHGVWMALLAPPAIEAILTRGTEVAIDANALISSLDYGNMKALERALAGRTPVISMRAAMEYVKKGDPIKLMRFLRDYGGRVSRAGCEYLARALRELAPKVPVPGTGQRILHLEDSEVAAHAVAENLPLITNDTKFYNLLKAAHDAGMSQFPKGEPLL